MTQLCTGLVCLFALSATGADEHTTDTLATVKKNLSDKKAVLLDVREKNEWEAGHLDQARLVPLSFLRKQSGSDGARERLNKKLPQGSIVYCHCRAGHRALVAAGILKQFGYDVRPLKPGYEALLKAGFAKAKPKKKRGDDPQP